MKLYKTKSRSSHKGLIMTVLFFLVIVTIIIVGLQTTSTSTHDEKRAVMISAIEKAVVNCYAIEGAYPESLEYIEENYAVQIDHENYIVSYRIFASNYVPDIQVFEKNVPGETGGEIYE